MNGFLFDTSVLSTFAPDRPPIPADLQDWILEQGGRERLFVSSIVILEIQRGIAKLERSSGVARAKRMSAWLENLIDDFGDRVIAVDTKVAKLAGGMEDDAVSRGRSPGLADVLIAATGRLNDLVVLTTNTRHFDVLNVAYTHPFDQPLPKD